MARNWVAIWLGFALGVFSLALGWIPVVWACALVVGWNMVSLQAQAKER